MSTHENQSVVTPEQIAEIRARVEATPTRAPRCACIECDAHDLLSALDAATAERDRAEFERTAYSAACIAAERRTEDVRAVLRRHRASTDGLHSHCVECGRIITNVAGRWIGCSPDCALAAALEVGR